MSSLPSGWAQKESKSHPGRYYYINTHTGETTWDVPTTEASGGEDLSQYDQVQVLHILKKHNQSRRPSSWRVATITQPKTDAVQQIREIRELLLKAKDSHELEALFREIASKESDCSSAKQGGDLGLFGRGQMQKSFEDASFALPVGGLSDVVDSDSGIHIILRVK